MDKTKPFRLAQHGTPLSFTRQTWGNYKLLQQIGEAPLQSWWGVRVVLRGGTYPLAAPLVFVLEATPVPSQG
jgi:hypothetical protein